MKITKEDLQIYMPLAVIIGVGAYEVYNVMKNKNSTLADKPAEKRTKKQREKEIKAIYAEMRRLCQTSNLSFYNKFLQADVFITKKSRTETSWHASKSEKSTQAVHYLKEVIENAEALENEDWISFPKKNNTNQKGLVSMFKLYYTIKEFGTIKLTIGLQEAKTPEENGRHIQYCITAIDKE